MKNRSEITSVNGGWVKRDTASGRFMEVSAGKTVSRASSKTEKVVSSVGSRRSDALKRLANR